MKQDEQTYPHVDKCWLTEADLFALFDQLGIKTETIEHPPLFTVEQGKDWHHKIPGLHCKNLFLKDKKGALWLIVMPGDKRANIKALEDTLSCPKLSFGKPDLLLQTLGITPGSVTPFALINDFTRAVTVVLDDEMMASDKINFHPLRNTASTCLKPSDFIMFIKYLSYDPYIKNCGAWLENFQS